ncbi:MAG TPA: winged helix-turn-helix domain-containing protein [Stellaceae bacterium]
MDSASQPPASVAFGRFQVFPHRRELLAEGRLLRLGGRAFDVLMALIEARGAIVGKDALMARVWPDRVVEENNLQVQIVALRKAFGAERGLIRTIAGHGYQFTGEIRVILARPDERADAGVAPPGPRDACPHVEHEAGSGGRLRENLPPTNLPEPLSELIGREEEVGEILNLAAAHRLVTLTGPGGIGKTQLALSAARRMLPQFADGVWLAEFSPLADPDLVPATVAAAIGLELGAGETSARRVAQAFTERRLLLIMDTCEHVIGTAAEMAEAVLRTTGSGVHIIATSREPLRAEGEQIYPVPPLAVPALEGEDPWPYGAVVLFVVRSRASGMHVSEDRPLAPAIAAICRRLDGIPLAIELAAARASAFGIEALAARLDDRFRLLTGGRRTALPRHQTLRATLDWSYELLADPERVLLRRLSAFAGAFSLEAAGAVAASPELALSEVVESLSNLVAKSLVVVEADGSVARYRLLDTTRAYALDKLDESGEREPLASRHAEYYRGLFERAEAEWETRPPAECLADYGRQIDNARAALDWAFSPEGDASIGVALMAAALPLWTQLSLLGEARSQVMRALAALDSIAAPDRRREMLLQAALANAVLGTVGTVDAVEAAWNRALELAEELDEIDHQLRALYGLYLYKMRIGEYRTGLAFARRFRSAAEKKADPSDLLQGDRIVGVSLFLLGDPGGARAQIERLLARSPGLRPRLQAVRFGLDQRVAALFHLSRILWVQGYPDQAVRIAAAGVDEAVAIDHPISLCFALADGACPVSAWVGDNSATARFISMLSERAEKLGLAIWHAYGLAWRGWLADREGDSETAIALFGAAIREFRATQFDLHFTIFLGSFAEILTRAGRIADGAAVIDEAVRRAELTEERWCYPELLRIRGDITWRFDGPDAAQLATDLHMRALDWARGQGALSWELRAAMSLARLLHDQGRPADALALLQPVYDRFTEGFDTADLKTAKTLLDAVR